MTDINAVNDIIKHIYKLCRNGRNSKLKQQPAYRRSTEKIVVLVHHYFLSENAPAF